MRKSTKNRPPAPDCWVSEIRQLRATALVAGSPVLSIELTDYENDDAGLNVAIVGKGVFGEHEGEACFSVDNPAALEALGRALLAIAAKGEAEEWFNRFYAKKLASGQ